MNAKIYTVQTSYIWGNSILFLFPLALTVITLTEGEAATTNEWLGLSSFWILCFLIVFSSFVIKIEVAANQVNHYFLGFRVRKLLPANIEVLEYGNLFRFGGLGVGKGLKIWEKTPQGRKYYSVGEKAFGKEAIEDIRRALQN